MVVQSSSEKWEELRKSFKASKNIAVKQFKITMFEVFFVMCYSKTIGKSYRRR